MPSVAHLSVADRAALIGWIGERPETVLPVAALHAGIGRVWICGQPTSPDGVLIESPLVPGEPQAFGTGQAILDLLDEADRWSCVELDTSTAASLQEEFDRRWGLHRMVTDIVHRLDRPVPVRSHPLVQPLTLADLDRLDRADGVLPEDEGLARAAADAGRLFGAVDRHVIVGQAGSMAAGSRFADVGVHVAASYRQRGIASAAASQTCAALQQQGLVPVWGTGAQNTASLAVASSLGFTRTATLTYLVRPRD